MVSSTLCPAVHILGSQNVYGRAEGIADHYWPWAVFFNVHYLFQTRTTRTVALPLFDVVAVADTPTSTFLFQNVT